MSNQEISKNIFGLNLTIPQKTVEEVKKVATEEVKNISVNPFVNYLEQNDKVFSGEIAKEIRSYQAQMYALGQIMREGQPHSSFDINI